MTYLRELCFGHKSDKDHDEERNSGFVAQCWAESTAVISI